MLLISKRNVAELCCCCLGFSGAEKLNFALLVFERLSMSTTFKTFIRTISTLSLCIIYFCINNSPVRAEDCFDPILCKAFQMLNSMLLLFCTDDVTSSSLTKPIQTAENTYIVAVQPSEDVDEESIGEFK